MDYLKRTRIYLLQAQEAARRDERRAAAMLDYCAATQYRAETMGREIEAAAVALLQCAYVQRMIRDTLADVADIEVSKR